MPADTSEPQPAEEPTSIDPTTIDLPYTLDNVLEIHTRLTHHESTLPTTASSYRHTASTYTAMLTTFSHALSLQLLPPTTTTALLAAGTTLQRAAQSMHIHLSSAEQRCANARKLLDEAMLTPAGGKEVAERVFEKFRAAQGEWRASVEHLRVAGRCLEMAAETVGPVVEGVQGFLGELEGEG